MDLLVDEAEIARRLAAKPAFVPKIRSGWLGRYAHFVTSASDGAVLRLPGAAVPASGDGATVSVQPLAS